MKSENLSKKPARCRTARSELLLTNLAFLLGVLTFAISNTSLLFFEKDLPIIANLDFRIFGCVFILFFMQLSAFSIVGSAIVPITDWAMGLFLPMSLATIIPNAELSAIIIVKSFIAVLLLVFICTLVSCGSLVSAKKLFNKVKNERRLKAELVKTLALALSFVILSIIGISDLNTFL